LINKPTSSFDYVRCGAQTPAGTALRAP
jgi:hypothetical protein